MLEIGWCLVTAYDRDEDGILADPLEDEIFLVKLDGTRVVRLAHHHSRAYNPATELVNYYAQPKATISAHGRFVVFDSDWGLDLDEEQSTPYLIDLAEAIGEE